MYNRSKELAGCETANAQIARLQSILRDLGIEGTESSHTILNALKVLNTTA
jgi:hypothetical protein